MTVEEDAELLRRYTRERSQAAFAELVRRHLNLVYAAALRRTDGDAALAEDVSQQAFIALAQQAKALQGHPTLIGWLFRTTRHLAANAVRSERARKLREKAHAMHNSTSAPFSDPAWAEIRPHLDGLIDQLDAVSRDAVVRRFYSGQKFAEMAAALHVSEDAARMRVERALDRLRVLLARRGVSSTTTALGLLLAALPAVGAPAGLAAAVVGKAAAFAPLATPVAYVLALNLMNTTKLSVATWSAAALLTLGGVYLAHEAGETRAQLGVLVRHRTVSLNSRPASPSTAFALTSPLVSTGRSAAHATVPPFVPVPLPKEEIDALMARFRALSPEVKRDRDIISNRIRVRLRFHALYAMLGLTRAQIDRFEKLAATQHLTFSGVVGTPEQVSRSRTFEGRKTDQIVADALGLEFVAPFRAYVLTSDLRAVAGELAANTHFTEAPLTAAQADRLVQLCVEHRGPDKGYARIDENEIDWPAVVARAGEFLVPAQVHALRATLSKRLFDIEYERATKLPLHRPIRHGL